MPECLARRMREDGVGVGARVFSKEDEGRWSRGGCQAIMFGEGM